MIGPALERKKNLIWKSESLCGLLTFISASACTSIAMATGLGATSLGEGCGTSLSDTRLDLVVFVICSQCTGVRGKKIYIYNSGYVNGGKCELKNKTCAPKGGGEGRKRHQKDRVDLPGCKMPR